MPHEISWVHVNAISQMRFLVKGWELGFRFLLMVVQWCSVYGEAIPVKELSERVASYVHLCTLYWWLRCVNFNVDYFRWNSLCFCNSKRFIHYIFGNNI